MALPQGCNIAAAGIETGRGIWKILTVEYEMKIKWRDRKKSQFQRQLYLLIVSSALEQHGLNQSGSCLECSLGRDGIKSSGEMQD